MNKEGEIIQKMVRVSELYRGQIIEVSINIEVSIDTLICQFFTGGGDRYEDLYSILTLNRSPISIHGKEMIIKYIIKNHYKDFYNKNKNDFDNILKLYEVRNMIAHRKLYIPEDYSELEKFDGETIYYYWPSAGRGTLNPKVMSDPVNNEFIEDYRNKCSSCFDCLVELSILIKKGGN